MAMMTCKIYYSEHTAKEEIQKLYIKGTNTHMKKMHPVVIDKWSKRTNKALITLTVSVSPRIKILLYLLHRLTILSLNVTINILNKLLTVLKNLWKYGRRSLCHIEVPHGQEMAHCDSQ